MTDEEKKKMWEDIQKRDPKLAELLKAIQRNFGKPEIKTVRWL